MDALTNALNAFNRVGELEKKLEIAEAELNEAVSLLTPEEMAQYGKATA